MSRVAYLWVALLVGLVCQPSNGIVLKQEMEERAAAAVEDKILSLTAQMKTNVEANDVDALLKMFTADVIFMGDGYPTLEGIDKLKLYMGWLANIATITIDTEKIDLLDADTVLQRGKYFAYALDGSVTTDGKILFIWKNTTDGWKIQIEMFNNDTK